MGNQMAQVKKFLLEVSGASSLEYTLLITFIAVVILMSISTLGTTVNTRVVNAAGLFSS
jgi:Flp pilus assembly pilin Flp